MCVDLNFFKYTRMTPKLKLMFLVKLYSILFRGNFSVEQTNVTQQFSSRHQWTFDKITFKWEIKDVTESFIMARNEGSESDLQQTESLKLIIQSALAKASSPCNEIAQWVITKLKSWPSLFKKESTSSRESRELCSEKLLCFLSRHSRGDSPINPILKC